MNTSPIPKNSRIAFGKSGSRHPLSRPALELEVKYPPGVLQLKTSRAYVFRIAMSKHANEADRLNNLFNGELKADDDVVLVQKLTQPLELLVPGRTKNAP